MNISITNIVRRLCVTALLTLLVSGCGSQDAYNLESRLTFPAQGQVLVNGKPVEGVQVIFHPVDPQQQGRPRGTTDAQGKFALRTYQDDDGAPSGEYGVTFYWPDPADTAAHEKEQLPRDLLRQRYADRNRSQIRATIAAGPTTLEPFEVTTTGTASHR